MSSRSNLLLAALLAVAVVALTDSDAAVHKVDAPARVVVGIIARNTAHTLSNFFGYLEALDYPRDRVLLWVRSAHSVDETKQLVAEWSGNMQEMYETVDYKHLENEKLSEGRSPYEMTEEWFGRLAQLRQEGLDWARQLGAHYLLWLDCDNFLVNNLTLKILIQQQKPLVAPMLEASSSQAYSNFWCGQNERGYYKRTEDYLPTLQRKRVGCLQVPVIFGTVLIDLHHEAVKGVAYWPIVEGFKGPVDDVIYLAYSAKKEGAGMFVLNTEKFGYIVKPELFHTAEEYTNHFVNFKLKTLVNHPPVLMSQYLSQPPVTTDTVGVDKIFMIGLERRPERRNRMVACLNQLHLNYSLFNAIDGRKLNESYINSLGIHYLPGWKDPWGERPMTFGEVGCFLSHYFIWQQMVEEKLEEVLVLEDDIDFEPNFRQNLQKLLTEARQFAPNWDLIYIGRKILEGEQEALVGKASMLVTPRYSYWTLGYLISLRGVHKLLEAQPLANLLPVDEFLPIMFDVHPQTDWADSYPVHNLLAYSAHPLLINPTHFAGDPEWFSDTEPPMEILEQIRQKKVRDEAKFMEEEERREKIKQEARQRQIQAMKDKLKPKVEL